MQTMSDRELRHLLAQPAYRALAKRVIDHAARMRAHRELVIERSVADADRALAAMSPAQRRQLATT